MIVPLEAAQYLNSNLPLSQIESLALRRPLPAGAMRQMGLSAGSHNLWSGCENLKTSSSVSARFAAAAKTYDLVSGVQRAVAEKLSAFLPPPEATCTVLEIGCGTGLFTELLTKRFPLASIDAVDISGPMIDAARKRIGQCERVRCHAADARRFCPAENSR